LLYQNITAWQLVWRSSIGATALCWCALP